MKTFILDQYISRDHDLGDLAKAMGVTKETLVNYRKRPHRMPFDKAVDFCKYVGISIDTLADEVVLMSLEHKNK